MSNQFESAVAALDLAEHPESVKEAEESFEKFAEEVGEFTGSIYDQLKTAGLQDNADVWYGIFGAAASVMEKSAAPGGVGAMSGYVPQAQVPPKDPPLITSGVPDPSTPAMVAGMQGSPYRFQALANRGADPIPSGPASSSASAPLRGPRLADPIAGADNPRWQAIKNKVLPYFERLSVAHPRLAGGISGAANMAAAGGGVLPVLGMGAGATYGLIRELLRTPEEGKKKQYLKSMMQSALVGGAAPLALGFGAGALNPASANTAAADRF